MTIRKLNPEEARSLGHPAHAQVYEVRPALFVSHYYVRGDGTGRPGYGRKIMRGDAGVPGVGPYRVWPDAERVLLPACIREGVNA